MVKKKSVVRRIEKNIEKEVKDVERWVIERKKFFIKLGIVAGVVVVLLIVSKIYLEVKGFG